jgi:putative FmdB family regulatory protein
MMPKYDFICEKCGHIQEEIRSSFETNKTAVCEKCGDRMHWKPTWGGGFKISFRDGFDACTGEYHPTQKHYENHLREHGMVKK